LNYLFEVRDKSTKRKIKIYGSAFHPILGPVFIIFKENQFLFSEVNNYTPAKENKNKKNEYTGHYNSNDPLFKEERNNNNE
jgi:hypothetical protein